MIDINKSPTLMEYKNKMREILSLYYPTYSLDFIDECIDEHIHNKFKDSKAEVKNSYTKRNTESTLLAISDFIDTKKPCVVATGAMFKQHDQERNLMFETMDSFLQLRKLHKKEMFKNPKGSREFAKYNLLQLLKFYLGAPYGDIGA